MVLRYVAVPIHPSLVHGAIGLMRGCCNEDLRAFLSCGVFVVDSPLSFFLVISPLSFLVFIARFARQLVHGMLRFTEM